MSYYRLPLFRTPLVAAANGDDTTVKEQFQIEIHNTALDRPQFRRSEKTTNIELFFDLFFVANLTSFTNLHEVNSGSTLRSYLGFFSILWMTWCLVTLHDVRFPTDSIFERLAYAFHFGVMVALIVVGPQYDTDKISYSTLQQLSLILMVSRTVLLLQYFSVWCFVRKNPHTCRPLRAIMVSLFIAASLYLGISFLFLKHISKKAHWAWYFIAISEVVANVYIAHHWDAASFNGTHLNERMTTLTLIILGEGLIGLTKSIVKIERLDYSFSPAAIGSIISAVLVIYFIYMLYFDNVPPENFGDSCQQIWTFFHFVFHAPLVLLMEGTNQFISWRHILEYISTNFSNLITVVTAATSTRQDIFDALNSTINAVLNSNTFEVTEEMWEKVQSELAILSPTSNSTDDMQNSAMDMIFGSLLQTILDGYGFEPPQTEDTTPSSLEDISNSHLNVFSLVFKYFIISAGLVLIFLAFLTSLPLLEHNRRELRFRRIGIVGNVVLGIALALLSTMVLTDAANNLGDSVWTLPLPVIVLFIALLLSHVPRWCVRNVRENQGD